MWFRDYFPEQQLLPAVMRYLTDPTQTPNSRVKVAALKFITQIAETAEPSALTSSAASALARLLDWSNDGKSQDVKRHAQNAVISLYNLNPPQVTMILSELPKYYQVCWMNLQLLTWFFFFLYRSRVKSLFSFFRKQPGP